MRLALLTFGAHAVLATRTVFVDVFGLLPVTSRDGIAAEGDDGIVQLAGRSPRTDSGVPGPLRGVTVCTWFGNGGRVPIRARALWGASVVIPARRRALSVDFVKSRGVVGWRAL